MEINILTIVSVLVWLLTLGACAHTKPNINTPKCIVYKTECGKDTGKRTFAHGVCVSPLSLRKINYIHLLSEVNGKRKIIPGDVTSKKDPATNGSIHIFTKISPELTQNQDISCQIKHGITDYCPCKVIFLRTVENCTEIPGILLNYHKGFLRHMVSAHYKNYERQINQTDRLIRRNFKTIRKLLKRLSPSD